MEATKNATERMFLDAAAAALPLDQAKIFRNEWRVFCLIWECPCPDIGDLGVGVRQDDIIIFCKITHAHFDKNQYRLEKLGRIKIRKRIVEDAVAFVAETMADNIAFTISYDNTGKKHGCGIVETAGIADSLQYSRKVFGPEMTMRAWTWQGEVKIKPGR